jgi:hypothetical protein
MSSQAPDAAPVTACPEPEQLAAYIDGRAAPDERTRVEQHLLECAECREIVAVSVTMEIPGTAGGGTHPRRRAKLWVGLCAALAAAAALVLAVWLRAPSPYYLPEMRQLVAAVGDTRIIEPRLSGGFAYGRVVSPRRGAATEPSLDIVAAAESVRSAARQRGTDAAAEAAGAVASVFVGDLTNAIEGLRRAAAASDDPRIQSDLSAVLLAQAERLGDATLVPDALRAADAAIASGRAPVEAYFNRALALEQLKRPDEAADAWAAYLDRDAASPWAAEARDHLRRLRG